MSGKKNVLRGLALKSVVAALFSGALGLASADQFGVQIADGVGDQRIKKFDLGVAWNLGLTWWQIGDWHFSLIGEAHAAW